MTVRKQDAFFFMFIPPYLDFFVIYNKDFLDAITFRLCFLLWTFSYIKKKKSSLVYYSILELSSTLLLSRVDNLQLFFKNYYYYWFSIFKIIDFSELLLWLLFRHLIFTWGLSFYLDNLLTVRKVRENHS